MSLCDGGCQIKPLCCGKGAGDHASGRHIRANSRSNMWPMDDNALFSSLRDKLFTAVVGDVLDKLGWRRQFLPQAIGPSTGHEDRWACNAGPRGGRLR
jgi:hypothetical protein